MNVLGWNLQEPTSPTGPNAPPPAGTTANMILRHSTDGVYDIYNIGSNSILASYQLGVVGTDWQFAGLGGFQAGDTSDMLLRNASTGAFEVYDISNNNITNSRFMGAVGMEWQVAGFGNFSGLGETDMILRNGNNGALEVYDIANNQITTANSLGIIGLEWQVAGFGNFSGRPGETDMIMFNTATGGLEVYDINNNAITGATSMGAVGSNWRVAGFGNFSSHPGETDMMLQNGNALLIYDVSNNQIARATFLSNLSIGSTPEFVGFEASTSNMILRTALGAFGIYRIINDRAGRPRLASRRAQCGSSDRIDEQLGWSVELDCSDRAGDGGIWRRDGRHIEHRPLRARHITAVVSDDTAARVTRPNSSRAGATASHDNTHA